MHKRVHECVSLANLILLGLAMASRLAEAGRDIRHLVVDSTVDETSRVGLASLGRSEGAGHGHDEKTGGMKRRRSGEKSEMKRRISF